MKKAVFTKRFLKEILTKKVLALRLVATTVLLGVISIVFSAAISAQQLTPQLIEGTWLTGTEGGKILTYQKDGKWFGKLVESDNADAPLGIDVLRNFTLEDGLWHGEIFSVKRDQLADATIEPSKDKLVIEVSIAFFSKTLEWHNEKQTKK